MGKTNDGFKFDPNSNLLIDNIDKILNLFNARDILEFTISLNTGEIKLKSYRRNNGGKK